MCAEAPRMSRFTDRLAELTGSLVATIVIVLIVIGTCEVAYRISGMPTYSITLTIDRRTP